MPTTFDNTIVSRIQQANDIVDVVGEHIALKRKGREMLGLCPFHEDHRPSLNVNPGKQIFKCFACGAGGDVFKFVQMRENLTFPQAIRRLAERAGIKIETRITRDASRSTQYESDPNELAKVNAWAARYFAANLADPQKGGDARKYLEERKINGDSIRNWQLGLALVSGDDLAAAAKRAKIPDKLLVESGLVTGASPNLADRFVNRLMFTITDVTGRIIGFGGRTLSGEGAKYINSPATALFDKGNALYGLNLARHHIVSSGTAVLVEGYTDCIMAHQFGCANVVAALGTSFTHGHARILRRYAKKIVLIFDSDTAGIEAANRAIQVALAQPIDIAIASVPTGKDPCDFLIAEGKDPFVKLIKTAPDVFTFKWNRLLAALGSDQTIQGTRKALDEFLDAVAQGFAAGNLPAIEKGLIVNRLARITALDPKLINAEFHQKVTRLARNTGYTTIETKNRKVVKIDLGQGLASAAQREILEVLLNEPALAKTAGTPISADLFDVPALRQIAELLFDTLRTTPNPSLSDILTHAESVELGNLIVELAHAGEEKANFTARLTGALDALLRLEADRKKTEIKPTDDQTDFLKRIVEHTPKRNPHTLGLT
jgi:DNA primase